MNAYLWEDISPVSDSYHDEGSVLIIATDLDAARAAWVADTDTTVRDEEDRAKIRPALTGEPTRTWPIGGRRKVAAEVFVFPNEGCC